MLRRWIAALVVIATLLSGPSTAQSAPGDQPLPDQTAVLLDVLAGFDGSGRVGTWLPVQVDLVNQGAEVRGEVRVSATQAMVGSQPPRFGYFGRGPGPGATVYSLPVILPRLSHKQYLLEVEFPSTAAKLHAQFVLTADARVVAEQDVSLARVPLGEYFCGILARDPASYDFLGALDLPPPIRRVRTAPLAPQDIPSRAQLLGSFDCLILDTGATSQLRAEQLQALQVWTAAGGLLVEVGGSNWRATLSPLPPDLVPVDISGITSVSSLSALGDLVATPFEATSSWPVSRARPKAGRGARVVANQGGVPLVVGSKRGDGAVIYLAFEPTGRDIRAWSGSEQLWRYILTHAAVDSGVGSSLVRPYLRWGRSPRAGLTDFSAHPRPSLTWLWGLVGGFALAVAAALVLTRRRDATGWSVLCVIGLTLAASAAAFGYAIQHADSQVDINRFMVVRPIDIGESSAAYTHEYVTVLAKNDVTAAVELPTDSLARGLVAPFPRDQADPSATPWQLHAAEGVATTLSDLSLRQGQVVSAEVHGQIAQLPGVQADLRLTGGTIAGTLANHTGQRLTNLRLALDDQVLSWGVSAWEKDTQTDVDVPVPDQSTAGISSGTNLVNSVGPDLAGVGAGTNPRRDLAVSLFSSQRASTQRMELRGLTLLGWMKQPPSSLIVPSLRVSTVSYVLLVQPLQFNLPRGFEGAIPSSSLKRHTLGAASSTPGDGGHYTVQPGEALTMQFTLPPSDGPFALQELRVNVNGQINLRGLTDLPFTVQLFNWRVSEWQGWDLRPGQNVIPNGDAYLSAVGDVRLRYALDAALSDVVRDARLSRLDISPVGVVR